VPSQQKSDKNKQAPTQCIQPLTCSAFVFSPMRKLLNADICQHNHNSAISTNKAANNTIPSPTVHTQAAQGRLLPSHQQQSNKDNQRESAI
jgi:hypothetical protein